MKNSIYRFCNVGVVACLGSLVALGVVENNRLALLTAFAIFFLWLRETVRERH